MNKEKIQNILLIIIKIFFVGLLLQFFAHTFVEFGLRWSGTFWSIFWMWKEILILILFGFVIYWIRRHNFWNQLFSKLNFKWFIVLLSILFVLVLLNGLFITKTGLSASIISLRYSITGFIIFIIFSAISFNFFGEKTGIEKRYSKIIGWLLRGSLFWWAIVYFVPRTLEFAGYNQYNYEGEVGIAPPAAYYSQYNRGYVRNQFLFERPISWGFFLIAFWPMFFALVIKRRGWKAFVFGGGFYALAIISTFSRAAWIARMFQCLIILLIEYRKNLKKAFLYGGIPILIIFGGITYLGRDQIIYRKFSNTGHIQNTMLAFKKVGQNFWFGEGPSTAGPGSHHLGEFKEYNPENQFLQIWIEYGFFGFLLWMILYSRFIVIGGLAIRESSNKKATKQQKYFGYLVFSLSLGILGLSVCGLVLHSFVDRMIVYPFMAMFGIIYGQYKTHNGS